MLLKIKIINIRNIATVIFYCIIKTYLRNTIRFFVFYCATVIIIYGCLNLQMLNHQAFIFAVLEDG